MLPSSKRLNLKKDFQWVRLGKHIESPLFRLMIRFGDNELAKVGIATSSKNFRKAVERNRARRLMSQTFQSIYSSLPNRVNIIALPKSGILKVKSGDVLLELEDVLRRTKIIHENSSS